MATIQAEYEKSFVMEQLDKYPVTDKEDKPRSEMSYNLKALIWKVER